MEMNMFRYKKDAVNKNSLKNIIELVSENVKSMAQDYQEPDEFFRVVNIGRLLEVEAYFHETDEVYNMVGVELDIESKLSFQSEPDIETGIFGIWKGKSHSCAPIVFTMGNGELGKAYSFDNGYGDSCRVKREIVSMEEMVPYLSLIQS